MPSILGAATAVDRQRDTTRETKSRGYESATSGSIYGEGEIF